MGHGLLRTLGVGGRAIPLGKKAQIRTNQTKNISWLNFCNLLPSVLRPASMPLFQPQNFDYFLVLDFEVCIILYILFQWVIIFFLIRRHVIHQNKSTPWK